MSDTTQNEIQEEPHGVTLGAICRVIFQWKRLLCLLAITLVAAIVTALAVTFVINPGKKQYEADFNFHVARVSLSTDLYESGQFFVDEDTLNAVKNSDDRFASIDVAQMLSGGKYPVKVTHVTEKTDEETTESYYTITVNEKVFPKKGVADAFILALIGYAKQDAIDATEALAVKDADGFNGYQSQLKSYVAAQTYEEKLSILIAQRNYLAGLYNEWIETYGGLYYIKDKKMPLNDLREMVTAAFSDMQFNELSDELSANAYVPGSEDVATLQMRLNTYQEQYSLNSKKLQSLEDELSKLLAQYKNDDGTSSSLMPQFGEFHSRIAALTETNAELQKKIETITELLNNKESNGEYVAREEKFGQELQSIYQELSAQSEQIATVAREIAERESYTTLIDFRSTGGTNAILVAVVVGIIAFVIASAVCCSIVFRREKSGKDEPAPQNDAGAAPQN